METRKYQEIGVNGHDSVDMGGFSEVNRVSCPLLGGFGGETIIRAYHIEGATVIVHQDNIQYISDWRENRAENKGLQPRVFKIAGDDQAQERALATLKERGVILEESPNKPKEAAA